MKYHKVSSFEFNDSLNYFKYYSLEDGETIDISGDNNIIGILSGKLLIKDKEYKKHCFTNYLKFAANKALTSSSIKDKTILEVWDENSLLGELQTKQYFMKNQIIISEGETHYLKIKEFSFQKIFCNTLKKSKFDKIEKLKSSCTYLNQLDEINLGFIINKFKPVHYSRRGVIFRKYEIKYSVIKRASKLFYRT